ncbi:hypothetical protein [Salibacterium sp. K-3]
MEEFKQAVENENVGVIVLHDNIASETTLNIPRILSIDFHGYSVTGDLAFTSDEEGVLEMFSSSASQIQGDLNVNLPNADVHVGSNIEVTGTTNVENVAASTFINEGTLHKVNIQDDDGTRFENEGTTQEVVISSSDVVLKGAFKNVHVADEVEQSNLTLEADSKIEELEADTDVAVNGPGEVEHIAESSKGKVSGGAASKAVLIRAVNQSIKTNLEENVNNLAAEVDDASVLDRDSYFPEYTEAYMEALDNEHVATAEALQSLLESVNKERELEEALKAVNEAGTGNIEVALEVYANLVDDEEVLDTTYIEPDNAAAYVDALNEEEATTAEEVEAMLKNVNEEQTYEEAVKNVNEASSENLEDAVDSLAQMVNDPDILDMTTYLQDNAALYEEALNNEEAESAKDVQTILETVNDQQVINDRIADVNEANKDDLEVEIYALAEKINDPDILDYNSFQSAYAESYVLAIKDDPVKTPSDIQTILNEVNKNKKMEEAISDINNTDNASDLEQTVNELAELVGDPEILDASDFITEHADLYLENISETPVDNAGDVQSVLDNVINSLNAINNASDTEEVINQLTNQEDALNLNLSEYEGLDSEEKTIIADAILKDASYDTVSELQGAIHDYIDRHHQFQEFKVENLTKYDDQTYIDFDPISNATNHPADRYELYYKKSADLGGESLTKETGGASMTTETTINRGRISLDINDLDEDVPYTAVMYATDGTFYSEVSDEVEITLDCNLGQCGLEK